MEIVANTVDRKKRALSCINPIRAKDNKRKSKTSCANVIDNLRVFAELVDIISKYKAV
jgi:hypothetical protein